MILLQELNHVTFIVIESQSILHKLSSLTPNFLKIFVILFCLINPLSKIRKIKIHRNIVNPWLSHNKV